MYLSRKDIEALPRIRRLNIINSITGIKPANLIGTKSANGRSNVAIFSSVVHLGSDPALVGFVLRPQHERKTDTYRNIKSTGVYTINHVASGYVKNAHFTSAKFSEDISEFDRCGLHEESLFDFHAPFLKESKIKMGLQLQQEIPITINRTILMVGQILHLQCPDHAVDEAGNLDLESADTAGISGVNTYYSLNKANQFPYAHVKDVPEF
ncbi:MAG: flavin reductase [Fulvivirga sp.]|nr:flavin reductase [Fulvivirga sp.]